MELCLLWIAVLLIAAVLEAVIGKLICVWFIPSSVISALLALLDIPLHWQIIAFATISFLGAFILRRFVLNAKAASLQGDLDSIVGERCRVIERIDTYAGCGHVRVRGQVWSARGINEDDIFEIGEALKVVGVEGVRVICKRK